MTKILIVEDEETIRRVLKNILLDENKKFEIDEAKDGLEAKQLIDKNEYDLVICDIKMPKMDGEELLCQVMKEKPLLPFIMISGHGTIEIAVDCIKKGAFDYISKPPDLGRLLSAVRNALDKKNLITENQKLFSQNKILKKKVSKKYEMIGNSKKLNEIKEIIDKIAAKDAKVLITGPNGTGKELVAHSIHEKSDRAAMTIVEVNCAAIPSELIESELFGHMKGSFTGAVKDKQGKFELADKGTLFLDEIGDMSLSAQAKVLRALQEGKVSRVGSDNEISVDVRVIAATNKNLKEEIKQGRFREDLYHRLSVIELKVPALKDRIEDIPLLIEHFSGIIAEEQGSKVKKFDKEAIELLKTFEWTGNIRELRNVVERLIILGGDTITKQDVINFC
ncbi:MULTISPECIES: sigma-54 dependent transcriptional regulator [Apibacter]|uniref:sigma-54-dependent transcriptional regulator n=1 Tax=Apibacter TaxID=1778601 RepID=UPI001328AF6D|nr:MULTISPECIES: sigma-54 dependent transcriptional regulator [Apibacter]MCX8677197.1 sigma-54-dependent Fis family transcriptional regulator [Apibacter sp. B3919]MXO24423.1 response regulator [Apibacter sp. B3924]MXO25667.1 response regulator [Apibacter sp. B3813]MXO27618.1 response regulator [Apibacter sp. B3913]MXO30022.1 response regulator [Apibacter sp. B3912]